MRGSHAPDLHRAIVLTTLLVAAFDAQPAHAAEKAEKVDLLLVLAADVSRSVDGQKFQLQREGYAAASPIRACSRPSRSGRNQRIARSVSWSGPAWQPEGRHRLDPDRRTESGAGLWRSAARIAALFRRPHLDQRRHRRRGGAVRARAVQFAERQTIDVSGDGTNNSGRDVAAARDDALRIGIIINGLVILSETPMPWNPEHTNPPGGLTKYYRDNVTGGPGSFRRRSQGLQFASARPSSRR